MEDTQEFTHRRPGTAETRWVRAVDLLPGTPSIVRSATIFVKGRAPAPRPRRRRPNRSSRSGCRARIPRRHDGVAFRLPAGRADRRPHPLQEDVAVRGKAAHRSQHDRPVFHAERQPAGTAVGADRLARRGGGRRRSDDPLQPHDRDRRAGARAQPGQGAGQHLAAGGSDQA